MQGAVLHQIYAVNQVGFPILTLLIVLPLIGIGLIWLSPTRVKEIALGAAVITFLFSLLLLPAFVMGVPDMQFVEWSPWIAPLGIHYHLGVDGISLLLVLLTTFLSVLIVLFSLNTIHQNLREYLCCLLALEFTLIGVFASLDLILFFLFWEVMLLPMYFLIKIFGGEHRDYAALKFVLYTLVGSVLMLVGFVVLALNYHHYAVLHHFPEVYSFSWIDLLKVPVSAEKQILIFLLLFFGFAFKVPMVPFHTWLPDAHVEAPTAGSVMLAGVLLKMGTYGFVRFSLPLLPTASIAFMPVMMPLAVVGILYGAFLALAQEDIKKLIAYSSISHLGFVVLGIFSFNEQAMRGGLIQMLNHGISTAGLFFVVGFLYTRRHTRLISQFGGLFRAAPWLSLFYLIITLSSLGIPGTNGFVGEFLILAGVFKVNWIYGSLSVLGVILGAAYLLWLYQRVIVEPNPELKKAAPHDLNPTELTVCVALSIVIFWVGLSPMTFLRFMDGPIQFLSSRTGGVMSGPSHHMEITHTPSAPIGLDKTALGGKP